MKETIEKINKTKGWLFEKTIKQTSFSQTHQEKKRKIMKEIKLKMKMEKTQQTTQKLQRITRDCYQQHLEETDKFLEKYNLPKLNKEKQKFLTDLSQE